MGIISTIGRKSLKVKLLIGSIYTILCLGSITMLYPFLLMISGTGNSGVDISDRELIPKYLYDDEAIYQKSLDGLFNEGISYVHYVYGTPYINFKDIKMPEKINEKLVAEWDTFIRENDFPFYHYTVGHSATGLSAGTVPENFRKFKNELYDYYDGDITALNRDFETEYVAWNALQVFDILILVRSQRPNVSSKYMNSWYKYKAKSKYEDRLYMNAQSLFKAWYLFQEYGKTIEAYNKAHNTNYSSYDEVILTEKCPEEAGLAQDDWEYYVREVLNMYWIDVDDSAKDNYTEFLSKRYSSIDDLNKLYGTNYKAFSEVPIVKDTVTLSLPLSDLALFVRGWEDGDGNIHAAPLSSLFLKSNEQLFRKHLEAKYGTIEKANQALDTNHPAFSFFDLPQYEYHYKNLMPQKGHFRFEYLVRNFIVVFDYVMLQGRGLWNTLIYCSLAILCALTVNPIAAYALSRFGMPSTYKVLLFLMLTMAFPPMVTQIPNFLMLREFNLLNTFWALILPGLANGYSIFLLKGFFDSLPKELYESAMLDGASEVRMFFQFTMALSKPILAVIALGAFTASYGNFMMALLICQDSKMWTLMPWLYQLQMSSCQAVIFASLIIASIPTFLVFMLCQNVIMRGIVVPVEK